MLRIEQALLRQGSFALRVDIDLPVGLTAILGPSGGGKSTLLGAVSGFVPIDEGRVLLSEVELTDQPPMARPVAVLFQDNNLFPHLTVEENVGLALRPKLRLGAEETDKVDRALAGVGLDGFGPRRIAELSGGQQSRAALARVLLQDRPVVCLDEPFAALGPGLREEMMALVLEKLADKTVLLVTHDPEDVRLTADRILFVDQGEVTGPFETAPFFANPPTGMKRYTRG